MIGILTSLSLSPCQAQENENDFTFWISGGLGKADFPSGMFAMGYEPAGRRNVIAGRFCVSAEFFQSVEPNLFTHEVAMLYGYRAGHFRLSAGLAMVSGNVRGKYLYTDPDPLWGSGLTYESIGFKTIGIPAEVRYMATLKHIGIGLTAFGNLNDKRSFAGLNVSLYFGKLK